MKGKLSRVWRSGLSMMMALIMMFSLGTAAFAVEIDAEEMLDKYNVAVETVEKVKAVADKAQEILEESDEVQKVLDSQYAAKLQEVLNKLEEIDVEVPASLQSMKNEVQGMIESAKSLKAEAEAAKEELSAVEEEVAAAKEELEALKAQFEDVKADLELETEVDFSILDSLNSLEDIAKLTPEQISDLKAQIDALKAELDAKQDLTEAQVAKADALKADIEAAQEKVNKLEEKKDELTAKVDSLEAQAQDLVDRAVALKDKVVSIATDVVIDTVEVVKNLGNAFSGLAGEFYASAEEQGYVALAAEKLDAVASALNAAKADVEASDLSAALKNDLLLAIDKAVVAADKLSALVENADKASLKALVPNAEDLVTAVGGAIVIMKDAQYDDLYVARDALKKAETVAKELAVDLVDIAKAAYAAATHAEVNIPCSGDYTVVAMGDSTAATYAQKFVDALGVSLVDKSEANKEAGDDIEKIPAEVKDAEMVILGYGLDGVTDFVAAQLNSDAPAEMDWDAVLGTADTVKTALSKIEAKLVEGGVSAEVVDMTMLAVESYAYGLAQYVIDYPFVINDIHDVNSDALVVIVGLYNPLKDVVLVAENAKINLGECLDMIVDATGLYNLGSAIMMPNTIYVEAQAVATSVAASEISAADLAYMISRSSDDMLPTDAGAAYIAEEIVSALTVNKGVHDYECNEVARGYLKAELEYKCKICGHTYYAPLSPNHEWIFQGKGSGIFDPYADMKRYEAALVFYRMLHDSYKDEANFVYTATFTDVPEDFEHGEEAKIAILTLAKLGVIKGYPDGEFKPLDSITRAEFVTMLGRISQMETDGTHGFVDVADDYYTKHVITAVQNGWVHGYDHVHFGPFDNVQRCQVAKMVSEVLGRTKVDVDNFWNNNMDKVENEFVDIDGCWGYNYILEVTNNHYHG